MDGSGDMLEAENRREHFNFTLSTKAGKYYGGHNPCEPGNNYPLCGDWQNPGISANTRYNAK